MPLVGFKPTIPAFERAKTVHASDRAATVIGNSKAYVVKIRTAKKLIMKAEEDEKTKFS
jgi:hypothetical protein